MSIESYQTNLDEAGRELRAAALKLEIFKRQELIFRDEDGITRCKNAEAGKVYGNWVRWNSDWNHWAERLRMAQQEAGALMTAPRAHDATPVQQDIRLPRERDDEDAAPF